MTEVLELETTGAGKSTVNAGHKVVFSIWGS